MIYAFDTNEANRQVQDLGLNGLADAEEAAKHPAFAIYPDPSADNYNFISTLLENVLERYKITMV